MHLYRVDMYALNSDGSVAGYRLSEYADTPEKVLAIKRRYEDVKLTTDAGEATALPAYKILIKCAKYTDVNVAQFVAMYA